MMWLRWYRAKARVKGWFRVGPWQRRAMRRDVRAVIREYEHQ